MQWLVDQIASLFSGLGRIIADACAWFFTEFYSWLVQNASSLITSALGQLNLPYNFDWAPELYQTANFFFPLNELFAIATVLFTFWLVIWVLKIVLKAIPTLW